MKSGIRNVMTAKVSPALFAVACALLLLVAATAKISMDHISDCQDQALELIGPPFRAR